MDEYTEIGGGKVGRNWLLSIHGTWPFARLTATRERLRLRLLWLVYEFSRSDVSALEVRIGVLGVREIRIRHSVSGFPPLILFWSYRFNTLRLRLEERLWNFVTT